MEFCYKDWARPCQCGGVEHQCSRCGVLISDCEYVSGWGTCHKCFSANFDQYLKDHPEYLTSPIEDVEF